MDEVSQVLQNNKTDDLTWFCSLSESELDFLISIKKLVIQRAKICGNEELAEDFDLRMLRILGLVLMEHGKERVQDDKSLAPSFVQQLEDLDNCSLLETHVDYDIDIEEILTGICNKIKPKKKSRKRRQ